MPTAADLATLYSQEYYESYADGPGMAAGHEVAAPYLQARLQRLTDRFGHGRMIDLGCGQGVFVAYARDRGWNAIGVETSKWAAEAGRKRHGVQIFDEPLEACPIPSGSIDVIHANHVLEHLADPVATMAVAHSLLKPGGLLVAEVPQELFVPLADVITRRLRRGEQEPPNYHLVFFSRRGLALGARRAGLEVESIVNVRHVEALRKRSPLAATIRSIVYGAERVLHRGPVYVLVAQRS